MDSVTVRAYAKLNFTLAITGVKGGYHMLDSIVSTVDMYDEITASPRGDGKINLTMSGISGHIPDERNNAYKAVKAYMQRFNCGGADIRIKKAIPVGAGAGGSSADASGALKAMNALYSLGKYEELKELADGLGSDTGYLLTGGFARLTGRGERVEKLVSDIKLNILLLLPEGGVSTAECYRLYDETTSENLSSEGALKALKSGDIAGFARNMNNALYASAVRLNPDISTAVREMKSLRAEGVNMTGSGSGVFGIFKSRAECLRARENYKGKFRCEILQTV